MRWNPSSNCKEIMNSVQVIIVSHAVFVNDSDVFGPGHAISSFLKEKNVYHMYIRHSLYDKRPTLIEIFFGKKVEKFEIHNAFLGLFRYISEIINTIRFLGRDNIPVFIGINPLNAFAGLLAKRLGKVKKVIFYTADYAYNRFENPFLNIIYHSLDRIAYTYADCVWNVSSRITHIREMQNVSTEKNIFVPNTPSIKLMKRYSASKKILNSLVLIANFTPAIDYTLILNVLKKLQKYYPNIHLSFIGTGVRENEIREKVSIMRLQNNVKFFGFQDHEQAMKIIAKHKVGLALYSKQWAWTEFGDSMKARDYLSLGLPVIMNKEISTSDDIEQYNAGMAINLSEKNLFESIYYLLEDTDTYLSMSKNAKKLARDFDLEKILTTHLLKKYLI